jgi:hypothetical protein
MVSVGEPEAGDLVLRIGKRIGQVSSGDDEAVSLKNIAQDIVDLGGDKKFIARGTAPKSGLTGVEALRLKQLTEHQRFECLSQSDTGRAFQRAHRRFAYRCAIRVCNRSAGPLRRFRVRGSAAEIRHLLETPVGLSAAGNVHVVRSKHRCSGRLACAACWPD